MPRNSMDTPGPSQVRPISRSKSSARRTAPTNPAALPEVSRTTWVNTAEARAQPRIGALQGQRHRVVGGGMAEPLGIGHRSVAGGEWRGRCQQLARRTHRERRADRRQSGLQPQQAGGQRDPVALQVGGAKSIGGVGEVLERHIDGGGHSAGRDGQAAEGVARHLGGLQECSQSPGADQQQRRGQQRDRARNQAQRRDEKLTTRFTATSVRETASSRGSLRLGFTLERSAILSARCVIESFRARSRTKVVPEHPRG